VSDVGVLDPWVAERLEANPIAFEPSDDLELARLNIELPVTRRVDWGT
jgi:hypothetical protein